MRRHSRTRSIHKQNSNNGPCRERRQGLFLFFKNHPSSRTAGKAPSRSSSRWPAR
jgi:hypothetical protein